MTRVRDLPARARMTRALSQLVIAQPFFGCLALSLQLEETSAVQTLATNGTRLRFNPSFVESLSEPELTFGLAHEVMHLACLHHVRRGRRDLDTWQRAGDYAINGGLVAAGFQMPEGALFSREYDGWGAEQIYAELMRRKRQDSPPPSQDGDEHDSDQAAGGPDPDAFGDEDGASGGDVPPVSDPGGCGAVEDAAPDESGLADAAAETEAAVRQAVAVAKAANAGTVPAFLERLVDSLNAPRISWREALASFVDDAATRAVSWNRPNKRFLDSAFFMPGTVADSVSKVAAIVDTSGSVDEAAQRAMTDELQGMLDAGTVESVVVIYCHQAVHGEAEFHPGDRVRLDIRETGGTLFGPAFRHVEQHHGDAAAVVYLTDLEPAASHPEGWGVPPSAPVLWAVVGRQRRAPFGTVLPIDPYG